MFIDSLKETLNGDEFNVSITENGALGYATTGKNLLDLNFAVASLRKATKIDIYQRFLSAFGEDKSLALKWLFFARDVRGGLGERRLFRAIMEHLVACQPREIEHLLPLIPEYGRWDDLITLLSVGIPETNSEVVEIRKSIIQIIVKQFTSDSVNMLAGKPISLLAKWLPSVNTSSRETVKLGRYIASKIFSTSEHKESNRLYRIALSGLRNHIQLIERKMSAGEWNEIDYGKVPSRANIIYKNAFQKHDGVRRQEFLDALVKGETKINAGVLFPHDIVNKYSFMIRQYKHPTIDQTLEELWKALPNTVEPNALTIVVADGSGSMTNVIGNTNIMALDVANALAIYFSERLSGEFKNNYITFSNRPQLVDLGMCNTLLEKIQRAREFCEICNTDIEKVFDLILTTAKTNAMKQEEIPANVLVISDMEFDDAGTGTQLLNETTRKKLFQIISEKWRDSGYKLPRLVFWNVNSRTGTIPVKENDNGVALVSGFSPNVAKMVMSGQLDPFECLKETLMSGRYAPIVTRDSLPD